MDRRTYFKIRATSTTTENQKQIKVDKLMYRQRKARSANFHNNRTLDGEVAGANTPNTTAMITDDSKPATAAQKKIMLKESLKQWRNAQKKRLVNDVRQKNKKPEFLVVCRHFKASSTPAAALPSCVKNSTYRNVSPRVDTRRGHTLNSTFLIKPVPSKFNFIGPEQNVAKPDVFVFNAAPMTNRYY